MDFPPKQKILDRTLSLQPLSFHVSDMHGQNAFCASDNLLLQSSTDLGVRFLPL